jgi:hypothetical protein
MTHFRKTPPLLPEETLHRVLRVANLDGLSVLAIAGILALAAAAGGDYAGAAIGLLVAAAGAIELHGAGLVRAGETRGMNWVVASQPYLLAVLLGYCALRLTNFDMTMLQGALTDEMRETIREAGYRVDQFLRLVYNLTYGTLAVATLIYQGGMTIYYLRRRAAVEAALEEGE